jgi:hypothetical protein
MTEPGGGGVKPRTMMPRGKDSHVHCCTCAAATTFARRNNSYIV